MLRSARVSGCPMSTRGNTSKKEPCSRLYRESILRLMSTFGEAPISYKLMLPPSTLSSHGIFADLDGEIPTLPSVNPNFGRARRLIDPGRRLQFGVRYAF